MLRCYHRSTDDRGTIRVEEIPLRLMLARPLDRLRGLCGRLANRFYGLFIKAGHF